MSLNLNPWLALLLGIIIGWLLEWLLELWFFRRRRLECQRRLQQVEGDLQSRERDLAAANAQADALRAELVARPIIPEAEAKLTGAAPTTPGAGLAASAAASLAAEASEVGSGAPRFELQAPEIELPAVEAPRVASEIKVEAASDAGHGPAGSTGSLLDLAEVATPAVELPAVEVSGADLEASAQVEATPPKVEVEWPQVSGMVADAGAALAAAEPAAPHLEAGVAHIGAELPEGQGEGDRFVVALPRLRSAEGEVALPEAAVEATAPTVQADDLSQIKGIGPTYAAQLSAAGITTFGALAATQPDRLAEIIKAPAWRKVDHAAWIAEAGVLARQPRRQAVGDELEIIEGIGPVYAGKLRAAGIMTFAQLAEADEARLSGIIQAPAWRKVNYADWLAQARLAAAGDQGGLKALQEKLFARESENLSLVSGIGEKTADALRAAGIGSFAALAAASPEQLGEITQRAGVRGGDFQAWIGEAKLRAAGKRVPRVHRTRAVRVSCPQDLSRVKGIGSVYEAKLYAGGIGSFWQLANAEDAELAQILQLKDFQQVDLAAIKADAMRLAEVTETIDRTWDGTPPDDFEPLEGIGEVYEGRLYDAGICTYRALADATVEQLAAICKAPAWRQPDYASWIAQARAKLG